MNNYSKGDWEAKIPKGEGEIWVEAPSEGHVVAKCYQPSWCFTREEAEANAQLIASAPKLHRFVEEMAEQNVPGAQELLDEIEVGG